MFDSMSKSLLGVSMRALACLFVMSQAFSASNAQAAEDSQATAVSQNNVGSSRSALEFLREKTSIGYYGIYYGSPVSDPGASRRLNEWGKPTTNQYVLNYLSLSYKASKTVLPGITVMSTYTPVRGQDLTLLDPYLKLTDTKLISSGNWTLYSELRHFLPVTKDSHDKHKMSTLGTFQWLTYNVPNTRFSVGAWAKFYWTIYGSNALPGTGPDYQAFLRPQVFYTIKPNLAASLYYEMYGNHMLGKSATDWYNAGTNVQMGAMWTVVQGLTLNPYLLFNTGGKVTADTTALGAQIFATLM
jgi:hypothetical protein